MPHERVTGFQNVDGGAVQRTNFVDLVVHNRIQNQLLLDAHDF